MILIEFFSWFIYFILLHETLDKSNLLYLLIFIQSISLTSYNWLIDNIKIPKKILTIKKNKYSNNNNIFIINNKNLFEHIKLNDKIVDHNVLDSNNYIDYINLLKYITY